MSLLEKPSGPPIATLKPSLARPTYVRYLILALLIAMSVLLYLDRFAISPAADTMIGELRLTNTQFGGAVGAFFWAYALMQVPAGWLTDRFGARWTLALYVVGWSLATIGLGLAQGLMAIAIMRIVLGVTQAGAYPAAAGLLKRWIPLTGRGLANSSVAMGGRTGLLLSMAITVPLMHLVGTVTGREEGTWRIVFMAYGLLGIAWAALFVWLYRDSPRQHPWTNEAEIELTAAEQDIVPRKNRVGLPILAMLESKEVWLMCVINIAVNIGWIFLATWLPLYVIAKHGDYITQHIGNKAMFAGFVTAATSLAAMCGGMSGGRATDVLVGRYGRAWGRRLPGMCAGVLVCLMYLCVPQLESFWFFVVAMIAIAFTIDFGLGATWASYQDIGGKHVASVLGCGNMCGNLAAAGYAFLIGFLADKNMWNTAFLISAGAMAIVALCWFFFDASRPIVREEPIVS